LNKHILSKASGLVSVLLTAMLAIAWNKVEASELIDPFEAKVEVNSRSADERNRQSLLALRQVLLKISGSPELTDELISELTPTTAIRLMEQFSYEQNPGSQNNTAEVSSILVMKFQERGVMRLVGEADLPVWPFERQIILPWVVIDDGYQRQLLGVSPEHSEIFAGIEEQARKRGVPMLIPLVDLEDQQAVSIADVWGGFLQPLEKASERYGDHHVVSAAVYNSNGIWQARWALNSGNTPQRWRTQAGSMEEVIIQGVDQLAEQLALRFAVRGGLETINLSVRGLASARQLGEVVSYLNQLSIVESVDPVSAVAGNINLNVSVRGGQDALAQMLNQLAWLNPVFSGRVGNRQADSLVYDYQR